MGWLKRLQMMSSLRTGHDESPIMGFPIIYDRYIQ